MLSNSLFVFVYHLQRVGTNRNLLGNGLKDHLHRNPIHLSIPSFLMILHDLILRVNTPTNEDPFTCTCLLYDWLVPL